MAEKLTDRLAVITGGSKGIGRATAQLFAQEGAHVLICARTESDLAATAEEINGAGGTCHYYVCDVRDNDQVIGMFHDIDRVYGKIDILMNDAGRMDRLQSVANSDDEITKDTFATNILGPIRVTREAWPLFRGEGCIVNVSSLSALHGIGGVAYTTSKYGLIVLTEHCAAMGMEEGMRIRANAVCPGSVRTTLNTPEDIAAFDKACFAMLQRHSAETKKLCEPEDVAKAALFFVSDDAREITGQTLYLDWGSSL